MEKKKFCQISFPVIDSALAAAAADERGWPPLSQFDNEREIDRLADGEKASKKRAREMETARIGKRELKNQQTLPLLDAELCSSVPGTPKRRRRKNLTEADRRKEREKQSRRPKLSFSFSSSSSLLGSNILMRHYFV